MVIQMIIHAKAALAASLLLFWQSAHIAEIIFAEQQSNTLQFFKVFQSFCLVVPEIIIFHFLIHSKELWNLFFLLQIFPNQSSLVRQNVLQHPDIVRHRSLSHHLAVSFSSHANGGKYMMSPAAQKPVFPVFQKPFPVT